MNLADTAWNFFRQHTPQMLDWTRTIVNNYLNSDDFRQRLASKMYTWSTGEAAVGEMCQEKEEIRDLYERMNENGLLLYQQMDAIHTLEIRLNELEDEMAARKKSWRRWQYFYMGMLVFMAGTIWWLLLYR